MNTTATSPLSVLRPFADSDRSFLSAIRVEDNVVGALLVWSHMKIMWRTIDLQVSQAIPEPTKLLTTATANDLFMS